MVKKLKIALVHDIFFEYGGAERVAQAILEQFPDADVYTLFYNSNDPVIARSFGGYTIRTSFLQHIPYLQKLGPYFSIFKLYSWYYFARLNLADYDVVISSSHSYNAKNCTTKPHTVHICYLHTPPKYLYTEENELSFIRRFPFNFLFWPFLKVLRKIDYESAQKPNVLITASGCVAQRAKQYYQRDSIRMAPPVFFKTSARKLSTSSATSLAKKYFIAHSRLVKQKGLDLIVKTCTKYAIPLVVIGDGYQRKYLESIAGKSIVFCGRVSDTALKKLYTKAFALLYAAKEEDFGLVPVEAQLLGVPVIAFKSGGVIDTLVPYKTGIFFDSFTVASLNEAVRKFKKISFSTEAIRRHGQQYNKDRFKKHLATVVTAQLEQTKEHNAKK